ncbi:DUF6886 family protein [Bacillus sp. RAR_GA_16]|uniref:DUF6886 family protein n=1 Tax=Bacillus sp. RAR_GA_16 TaxID=2876774 RepID=UPI001CCE5244|nr:DUF6886 family protein [Bacillus sp. RAR_GA_16]MCA0174259.1 hypothetical protein [Bacillus sp. RAR_GA_16]
MRIFHVSEEDDLQEFQPRVPTRKDLDQSKGLVWAVNETCLPNFLTPRNCPRVCFRVGPNTSNADKERYLSSSYQYVVIIEKRWADMITNTPLYLYEFNPETFYLQDDNAGYYVSERTQVPMNKMKIKNPLQELFRRQVEVRFVDLLWDSYDEIQQTTFHWSMCRMRYAKPRS